MCFLMKEMKALIPARSTASRSSRPETAIARFFLRVLPRSVTSSRKIASLLGK